MHGRALLIAVLVLVFVAAVLSVREHQHYIDAHDRAMAQCIEYAKANVSGVSPEAWCEP